VTEILVSIWRTMSKGCWACRERRVRCDRGVSGCSHCARNGRACPGYALRLSWPQNLRCRRAIVYTPSGLPLAHDSGALPLRRRHFINTTSQDTFHSLVIVEAARKGRLTTARACLCRAKARAGDACQPKFNIELRPQLRHLSLNVLDARDTPLLTYCRSCPCPES
jgi:hypothetical protein